MISLKQIHYALAVERHLHFRRAAEDCNISQSALSTALSEMEKQLGFQIFERDNRKVLVTPLGQQVLERARSIQLQMQDIVKLADSQRQPLSTPMSLGVIPTIGPYLLPRVLPDSPSTTSSSSSRVRSWVRLASSSPTSCARR